MWYSSRVTEKGNQPATKADLHGVRDELKADISRLDGKIDGARDELEAAVGRVAAGQIELRGKMATKDDIRGLRDDFERMYRTARELADKGRVYFEKAISHGDQLQGHEATPRDHGQRIASLESSRPR